MRINAHLILNELNCNDVVTTIENELNDLSKFQKIKGDVTKNITKEMRREIDYLVDNDKLSSVDRTLIRGETEEGGLKQNPEFKPETLYAIVQNPFFIPR